MFLNNVKTKYIIANIENSDYPYYHVSDHPELPKATSTQRHDPWGIYLFIKGEYVGLSAWANKKYRWDAKLKPGVRILDLSKVTTDIAKKLFTLFKLPTLRDVWDLGDRKSDPSTYDNPREERDNFFYPLKGNPSDVELKNNFEHNKYLGHALYRILRLQYPHIGLNNKTFSNLFQKLGYDGIKDTVNAIYPDEPQLIIFDEKNIIWGEQEKNTPDSNVYQIDSKFHGLISHPISDRIKMLNQPAQDSGPVTIIAYDLPEGIWSTFFKQLCRK